MSEKPTIGFIGVGFMGHGMALNLLKNGYPPVSYTHLQLPTILLV